MNKGLVITIVIVLVLALGAVGYYYVFRATAVLDLESMPDRTTQETEQNDQPSTNSAEIINQIENPALEEQIENTTNESASSGGAPSSEEESDEGSGGAGGGAGGETGDEGENTQPPPTNETEENETLPPPPDGYTFTANLVDVTNGELVRSVLTGGSATGVAYAKYDPEYDLQITIQGLPVPENDEYYEAFIVRNDPFSVLSVGTPTRSGNNYVLSFTDPIDYTDHDFIVVTIEISDGDPEPSSDHVLTATFS
jgi:hypothetical protein